ncbi:MAG: protease family protein [Chloroflexota bacterium]|nr:protease family protein [Chloroflexota bacterium]
MANIAVGRPWGGHAIGILAGITAGVTFLAGLSLAGGLAQLPGAQLVGLGAGIMATGVAAATLASKPVRDRVSRVMPIDPDNPVHAYALVLAVVFLGSQLAMIAFIDNLAVDQTLPAVTIADVLDSEVPFLILALAGVGLYIRRNFAGAALRLGVTRPTWWQVVLALAAAGAFFAFIQAVGQLSQIVTPQVAGQVEKTTVHMYGGILGDPLGVAALALLPGICEEILFRGALQPRLGLIATAALFTSIHTQYGLSFDTLSILVVAIGLGLIRKYTNTTTSGICHVTYNLLTALPIAGGLLGVGAGIEVVLIVVAGYAIWSNRRGVLAAR